MLNVFLVAVGGALGAVGRYLLGIQAFRMAGAGFPYGTFVANILGGLMMGALVGVLALRGGEDQEKWRLLVGVGVLGGFTTFSSFSLETLLMIQRRDYGMAAAYSAASVAFSVTALFVGLWLMRRLLA